MKRIRNTDNNNTTLGSLRMTQVATVSAASSNEDQGKSWDEKECGSGFKFTYLPYLNIQNI